MRHYQVLSTTGMGFYDEAFKWNPASLLRCNLCGTVIAEDGFFGTNTVTSPWPKDSFRAKHAAACLGEDAS